MHRSSQTSASTTSAHFKAWETVWCPSEKHAAGPWSLTLQCKTTTCWGSEFSQFSMALHMAQILSSGGAWRSGQPKSWTWRSMEKTIKRKAVTWILTIKNHNTFYLRVESADVVAPLREIQQLKTERFFYLHFTASQQQVVITIILLWVWQKKTQTAYLWVSILQLPVAKCQTVWCNNASDAFSWILPE